MVDRDCGLRAVAEGQRIGDNPESGGVAPGADFDPRRTEPVGGDHAVDAHRRARRSPYDLDPRDRRLDADRWIEIERSALVDPPRARKIEIGRALCRESVCQYV